MAIQINPSGGGIAPVVPLDPAAPTGQTAGTTQVAPRYQLDFGGMTRSLAAGLSAPSSVGDIEVLFAQIASNLKDSLGALSKMDNVARAESSRGALGVAMAAFDKMVRWGATIDVNNANIKTQQGIIDEQTPIKTSAERTKAGLEGQRSSLQTTMAGNNSTISSLQTSNSTLATERNTLATERSRLDPKKPADATRIAQIDARTEVIRQTIDANNARIGQLQFDNAGLQRQIDGLNPQIAAQQAIIDTAAAKIDAAQKSQNQSAQVISQTKTAMGNFVDSTILLLMASRGGIEGDMARDAAQVETEGDAFDTLVSNLARALVLVGEAMAEKERDADVVLTTEGAGLNLEQSMPNRFGMQSSTVSRAIAFAGLVAGTIAVVNDLLRSLTAGLGMQSAESFAQAGEPRVRVPV